MMKSFWGFEGSRKFKLEVRFVVWYPMECFFCLKSLDSYQGAHETLWFARSSPLQFPKKRDPSIKDPA